MSSKAKKKGEKVLLLPGSEGWEVWTAEVGEAGFRLHERSDVVRVLDVVGIPAGELTMAFPVRDVSALPFRAATTDDALLSDLAETHLERMGSRPGIDAGVLSDTFKVGTRGEETLAVPVVLAPPFEGDLPRRAPQNFDISSRCLPMPSTGLVVWRELGRWVFALAVEGQPLEYEALAINQLGEDAGREIRLAMMQMELQGLIETLPQQCIVWVGEGEAQPRPEELQSLGEGVGLSGPATVERKPAPVVPDRCSQLLPADVRADRVAKRKKQQVLLGSGIAALAYVILIGLSFVNLSREKAAAQKAKNDYAPYANVFETGERHIRKWQELSPVIEQEYSTVELLYHCIRARQGEEGVRLDRADIINQVTVDGDGQLQRILDIRLQGKTDELGQANAFDEALQGARGLIGFQWTMPSAQQKGDKWAFQWGAAVSNSEGL